jgi:RNA polymerase sigma-54 factor
MLKQTLSQKLLQKLSPQQIQFIKLLELTTANFEERVEEELLENAALETGKESEEVNEGLEEQADQEMEATRDDDFDVSDYLNEEEGGIQLNDNNYASEEDKHEIPVTSSESFREALFYQVLPRLGSEHREKLAKQLIGTIENDGYLRRPLRAIVNDLLFSSNIKTSEEELEKILILIQAQEPPGIGARSLAECLLLQVDRIEENHSSTPITKLTKMILKDHMDDFSKKHYNKLIQKLDVTEDFLKEAVSFIVQLNPKPAGSGGDAPKAEYITPDFIVEEEHGELKVRLNNRNAPELRISAAFKETLKHYDKSKNPDKKSKEAATFVKQKLDSAKWFVDAVKQRQNTLLITMQTIVQLQKRFFLTGDETTLRPMILKDIADLIKMDISTVSRVASSKYVETEFGIFLLKFFFSEGIMTADGHEVSNKEVKIILKEAIGAENKNKPLTDGKLMELLKEKGYNIARRTVAKYREQMNIPVARLRKEL